MSWYKRGEEAHKAIAELDKVTQMMQDRYVPRFFLRPDQQADVIFVDDEGFFCERHLIQVGGRWQDVTCCAAIRPCPICLSDNKKPMPVVYYTIIDLRSFLDRNGKRVPYRKVLLGARRQLAKQIKDFKDKYGSLVGLRFTLKRYQQKEAACGSILGDAYRKDGKKVRYNLAKLGSDFTTPFDYEKLLAPPSPEEYQAMGYRMSTLGDSPLDVVDDELEAIEDVETQEDISEDNDTTVGFLKDTEEEDDGLGTIIEEAYDKGEDDDNIPF